MAYYDILHQNYNFLHVGYHNINIRCYNFFKKQKYFRHLKFFKQKNKTADIKCTLKSDGYTGQSYKAMHSMSDFLYHRNAQRIFCFKLYPTCLGNNLVDLDSNPSSIESGHINPRSIVDFLGHLSKVWPSMASR